MITKQIKFTDVENAIHGGILIETNGKDNYVICGCCGGIFEMDEIHIITKYETWLSLDESIIGE